MKRSDMSPKQRLMRTAESLFYREGIRGVGVEAIAAQASTTKMALYRHFDSKDALVSEWMQGVASRYQQMWADLEARYPDDPLAQLNEVANRIATTLLDKDSRGCAMVNSVAELPDASHPARRIIDAHKHTQLLKLEGLCKRAGLKDPEGIALELHMLFEGAQIAAQSLDRNRVAAGLLATVQKITSR